MTPEYWRQIKLALDTILELAPERRQAYLVEVSARDAELVSSPVLIDNTQINGTTYTYEPPPTKNDCKNGGWKNLTDSNGQKFKNQGDCVSSFATGGNN